MALMQTTDPLRSIRRPCSMAKGQGARATDSLLQAEGIAQLEE